MTGISTPLFGIQWNPPSSNRDQIQKFLAFLEDRRALFTPASSRSRGAACRRFLDDSILVSTI
ncbi:hypothetical protein [Rhizobium laguerreae]|uniref:hypothetical protein n=1 Tax=Rhizobium laguerreae TaxID=1076926 RepID=UPI0035E3F97D